MVMLPMTWVTLNHLKPPQFLHSALPYASSQLAIAKTSYLMCKLNVQVTAYGRQNVPDSDPLKYISYISLERLNVKSSNFVHSRLYQF